MFPFSKTSENREESFTKDMEVAAIFCFAELERAKGGGLILKQPEEKLAFIVEGTYPFWLVPWKKRNLLFDGLGKTSHTFVYASIPDVKSFMENAETSSRDLETYISFLSENLNYFQQPSTKKELVTRGLIADASLINEFSSHISEAQEPKTPLTEILKLEPAIDKSSLSSAIQEVENIKAMLKEEVQVLYKSMKLLNGQTQNFAKELRGQIKAVKEEFDKQIKEQQAITKSKVKSINEGFDEKIKGLAKDFERKLLPLQKEKIKLEKAEERLKNKIERYKLDAKTCAAKKDFVGERKWKEKISQNKREISEIEKKIKNVKTEIDKLEESKSEENFRLRSELEAKINEAKKDLFELEAARDAKIEVYNQKMEKIEGLTLAITEKINKVAKMRTASLSEIENLGMEQKQRTMTLAYMPFYIVCYQFDLKNRYVLFPPSTVNSISFSAKIKGALGMVKIKQLLTPRFEALKRFLSRVPSMIGQNPAFEREIFEAGNRLNLLKHGATKERIGAALKRFMEEGWLSEKDYENFIHKLG
jgi:DNA repair exonuclease SbcCD ATPase subunit